MANFLWVNDLFDKIKEVYLLNGKSLVFYINFHFLSKKDICLLILEMRSYHVIIFLHFCGSHLAIASATKTTKNGLAMHCG